MKCYYIQKRAIVALAIIREDIQKAKKFIKQYNITTKLISSIEQLKKGQ